MYPHIHRYKFESKNTNRHNHKIIGYTDNMIGIEAFIFMHTTAFHHTTDTPTTFQDSPAFL